VQISTNEKVYLARMEENVQILTAPPRVVACLDTTVFVSMALPFCECLNIDVLYFPGRQVVLPLVGSSLIHGQAKRTVVQGYANGRHGTMTQRQ
jgi:hypothetical protein